MARRARARPRCLERVVRVFSHFLCVRQPDAGLAACGPHPYHHEHDAATLRACPSRRTAARRKSPPPAPLVRDITVLCPLRLIYSVTWVFGRGLADRPIPRATPGCCVQWLVRARPYLCTLLYMCVVISRKSHTERLRECGRAPGRGMPCASCVAGLVCARCECDCLVSAEKLSRVDASRAPVARGPGARARGPLNTEHTRTVHSSTG